LTDRTPTGRRRKGRPRLSEAHGSGDPRRDILAAAAHLISEQGLNNTTMAQIAEAAGLQTPSMYYYFDGKGGILRALAIDANRAPLEIVAAVRDASDDPAVQLWATVALDVRTLCELPFDINEVHRFVAQDEESQTAYTKARDDLIGVVAEIVADGIGCGAFHEVDAALAAVTLLANDEGSQNWIRSDPDADPVAAGTFLADLALRGLAADPSTVATTRAAASELVEALAARRDDPDVVLGS
jgi:AcrR family transcriptional regulator